jgi:hypothetical protein
MVRSGLQHRATAIGNLLARGTKASIPTPLHAAAYAHMSVYQRRLAKS